MNTVLSQLNEMLKLCEQTLHPRSEIPPKSTVMRMEVRIVKAIQDAERLSALLCASCEEIGIPDSIDLTVELGVAIDE